MGLKLDDSADTDATPQVTSQTGQPNNAAPSTGSVNELPQAALDLAASLFNSARTGDAPHLSQYLSSGLAPNLTNSNGDSLLTLAAYHGHLAAVQLLLSFNADPNFLNGRGQSALTGAVFKGYDEVVKELVKNGADVNVGKPTAVESGKMFKRWGALEIMGVPREEWETGVEGLVVPGGPPEVIPR